MTPSVSLALIAMSMLAVQDAMERSSRPRTVRVDPPAVVPVPPPSISSERIEKLWIIERHGVEAVWGREPSSFGRIVEAIGDVDGRGCEDLLVGARVPNGIDSEVFDLVRGESPASATRVLRPVRAELVGGGAGLGDLDRDGAPDFAIVGQDRSLFLHWIDLCPSSRSHAVISEIDGKPDRRIGGSIAPLRGQHDDVDGDGWVDVVVASNDERSYAAGSVHSSRTGAELLTLDREQCGDLSWSTIEQVATSEAWIAISAPLESDRRGRVRLWSAENRELSLVVEGGDGVRFLGTSLAWLAPDRLAISAPWSGADRRGSVHLLDVDQGRIVAGWSGVRASERAGISLDARSDLDGDGIRDLVVGAPASLWSVGSAGSVEILSGRTGRTLLRIEGPPTEGIPWDDTYVDCGPTECDCDVPESLCGPASDAFGHDLATGDLDGDGLADLAIGFPRRGPGGSVGEVLAISGVELRRCMTKH